MSGTANPSRVAGYRKPRQRPERIAIGRCGNPRQRLEGLVGLVFSESGSVIKAPGAFNDGAYRRLVLGAALLDRRADHLDRSGIAVTQRMDQGQCRLALREIVTDILAEFDLIAAVVERVVNQLECNAQVLAVTGQCAFGGCRRPGHDRPNLLLPPSPSSFPF